MEPVLAAAVVHGGEPTHNIATVVAAVAVHAVPSVPVVTAVAEASTIDDIPAVEAELISVAADVVAADVVAADVTGTAAVDGAVEKRGRKRGTTVPRWTPEEEARLRQAIEELGEKEWTAVAGRLETGRGAAGVEQHWQIMSGKRKRNGAKEDGEGGAGETTPGSTSEKKAAKLVLNPAQPCSTASRPSPLASRTLALTLSPQPAARSPRSAARGPQPAARSPQPAALASPPALSV